jgi:hypothetical protein
MQQMNLLIMKYMYPSYDHSFTLFQNQELINSLISVFI